jgi:hypothetical protein
MAIILRKNINEVRVHQAVSKKENLPQENNCVRDVRYVRYEQKFYIFNGYTWQELDLVIE